MAAQDKKEKPAGPRFEVRVPVAGFRGERAGLRFNEGVAHTDDPKAARACEDIGYQVTDHHQPEKAAAKK
jgi:hypothetical protein